MSGVVPPAVTKIMVSSPDFVVVARGPGKPEVISDAAMVAVSGGARFAGNGYVHGEGLGKRFTFGVNAPSVIGVVSKSGQKRVITDATKVLFCGGTDPYKTPAPTRGVSEHGLSQLIQDHDSAGHSEIVDDEETHIIDNGASIEMADRVDGGITDFDELVKKRNEALQATDGDELAAHALLAEGQHADLATQAPWVRSAPPSIVSANLGSAVDVRSNDVAPTQVALWPGQDAETRPITVTLFPVAQLVTPTFGGAAGGASPYADVQWGTRASLATVRVDIGRGVQFTVCGSYCALSVGVESSNEAGLTPALVVAMKLMGMLSFEPCVRTTPITRTAYLSFNAGGGGTSGVVQVPACARNVIVLPLQSGSPPVAADYEILFLNSDGNTMYTRTVRDATSGPMLVPYPLTTDITGLRINTTGLFFSRLLFELGI